MNWGLPLVKTCVKEIVRTSFHKFAEFTKYTKLVVYENLSFYSIIARMWVFSLSSMAAGMFKNFFWHMHAHKHRRTRLCHTSTHTRSNATVVRGVSFSFPLAPLLRVDPTQSFLFWVGENFCLFSQTRFVIGRQVLGVYSHFSLVFFFFFFFFLPNMVYWTMWTQQRNRSKTKNMYRQ